MEDGCRLTARIWLPDDAETNPVPAVLEYIPYRRGDGTAARDASMHPHFAAAGYAAVRVDMRGSGDSDGVMLDEYAAIEQSDALEVLRWLAAQPWCTGRVGMLGKSWGGFNGLQVAALAPPELQAVVTVCSTDDRYADDVHYTGGSLLASEMLPWASTMLAWNGRPHDPATVGDDWEERWVARLDQTPPYDEIWLRHQLRDDYWKHGSTGEDPASLTAPVLAVGGLGDPYRGAVFRLLETLDAPVKGLIGPWAHNYPHQASPGPGVDFVGEALRWFDKYLKDIDTGVADDPDLRIFVPDGNHAAGSDVDRAGRWVGVPEWPGPAVEMQSLPLDGGAPDSDGIEAVMRSDAPIGSAGGSWLRFGDPTGDPVDQRGDDAHSYSTTFAPLGADLDVLGVPAVRLRVSADKPVAQLAVRLCDVHEDGTSELVTAGLLNLTHDAAHETATDLEPGQQYTVEVPLVATAHRFLAGHRVRVAVSAAYWPWAWPSPEIVQITVHSSGDNALQLPTLDGGQVTTPTFGPIREDPQTSYTVESDRFERDVTHDHATGHVTTRIRTDSGRFTDHADGRYLEGWSEDVFTADPADPLSAAVECRREETVGRGNWETVVRTRSRMSADAHEFLLTDHLVAEKNGTEVFQRTWEHRIPRNHV
nr:CocE/NonD family hydrolase [Spelaeicoccus albus]